MTGSSDHRPAAETGAPSTLLAIGYVAATSVASRALRFLKTLIVVRLLVPEAYGVYAAVAVLATYAQFLDLGASTAAFRDLAGALGRGDAPDARQASGRMGTLKLAAAAVLGAGSLVAALSPALSIGLRQGIVALPVLALSSALLAQVLAHLQAEDRAGDYSRVTALASASDLVLCVGLTAAWSLPGLLAAAALSPLVAVAWAASRGALAPLRSVPLPVLRRYLWTGIPLAALALLDQSLLSVGQLVVMGFLALRDLGLYNAAFALAEAVRTLGLAAAAVIGPRLLREHARSGARVSAIRRHTLYPVLVYAKVLPVVVGLLWVCGSYALLRFYPAYGGALRPMQVLLIATDFLVVLGGVTTFLFAIDKHPRNLLFLAPAVCFNVGIDVVLLRLGWGLVAVATGSLVTYFGYASAVLWYVSGHFDDAPRARLAFLAGALLPGIGLGLAMSALERFVPYRDSLAGTAAAAALVVVIGAPLAWRGLVLATRLDDPWSRGVQSD
jgi:O-antigen/teichoic acid export membrane protein